MFRGVELRRLVALALAVASGTLQGCSKPVSIKAIKVGKGTVETTVTTISSGTVLAENQAVLNFGGGGRVQFVGVRAGDRVKKGQRLAHLENSDLSAASSAATAEYKRVQRLVAESLVAQAALDEAKRAFEMAQSAYERSLIVAPYDAIVTDVNLNVGEVVTAQIASEKPPLRIISAGKRIVKGEIDELDLGKVRVGMSARLRVPALNNKKFDATVSTTVPFVSSNREQDRTSLVELRFVGEDSEVPVGASVEIEIVVDTKSDVIVVPAKAILGSSKQRYLFVVEDGVLKKREVQLGSGNYERREVATGLSAAESVALPHEKFELVEGKKVNLEFEKWP